MTRIYKLPPRRKILTQAAMYDEFQVNLIVKLMDDES